MTHKCFKCERRFPTSGAMVQHMREDHSSFVKDAKEKIDRSQEISFEAKRSSESYVATAKCPFCLVDCVTRRKLMHHLSVEHQDEEDDAELEPELKIIRVENDKEDKLLGQLRNERDANNVISPNNNSSIVKDLLNALDTDKEKKEVSIPGTSTTVQVSATSIKLAEKRYRCFWCDASFRKRGKLMDHIDMFHKANKQQTEVEAEQIVSSTYVPATTTEAVPIKPSPPSHPQPKKVSISPPTPKPQSQKAGGRRRTNSRKSSVKTTSSEMEKPETVDNKVCKFICLASITETCRIKVARKLNIVRDRDDTNCRFFSLKDSNPLPPLTVTESMIRKPENKELPPPVQDPSYLGQYSTSLSTYDDCAYYQQCQQLQYEAQNSNMRCPPTLLPLPKPQAVYPPTFGSVVQFYHQRLTASSGVANQLDRDAEILNYQHGSHNEDDLELFNYPVTTYRYNPDGPLDLTMAKP